MFRNQRVLVTGGTGLIGRFLVESLIEQGARVRVASLDAASRAHPEAEFMRADLTEPENCRRACQGMDYVFHLAGVKGSPAMTAKQPASFFVPTLSFNTHMMEAARRADVKGYLFTSTVGVYAPAECLHEDAVWSTFPSPNDRFAGWAKRMGELQADAYRIEYGWDRVRIVRPANVYGPFDHFDGAGAMVIPSLIRRAVSGENPLVVWGDGSPLRDFIHARDVAAGMMLAMEKGGVEPINLGSGEGVSIRRLVEIIVDNLEPKPEVVWDESRPMGDRKRVMDISRARALGFSPQTTLIQGVREVVQWYRQHRDHMPARHDAFAQTPQSEATP